MTDQWQELKETIIEMRDNNGTGIQQEVCKFLVNYMEILEKQMQEPCEKAVSIQAVLDALRNNYRCGGRDIDGDYVEGNYSEKLYDTIMSLPLVTPQPKIGKWFVDERPESNREIICSNCEQPIFKYHKMDFDYRPKYCPNCGSYNGG